MSSVKLRKEKDCLNCGHIVEEKFCPNCGQENIVVKEDALHMVAHAIADYFHFEHKFFGTLKPLLLKPGQLTKSYVAGKRVSFIHPIRLYIFVSIVFFIAIFSGKEPEKDEIEASKTTTTVNTKEKDSLADIDVKNLEKTLSYIPVDRKLKDSIINEAKKDVLKDSANAGVKFGMGKKKKWNKFGGDWVSSDTTVAEYEKKQLALPKAERDGFIQHYFAKRIIELNQYPNPGEKFKEDLLHNIPKMMFLLLPMFALILKLVYINKKRFYYEHIIYSFHLHSAMFLSILVMMLLKWLFGFVVDISGWLEFICTIYIIWYIYRSLRTFYGSKRWITILKMFFLGFCYMIVFTICILIVMAFSFVMV
ncbi:DUF3667 domain-containing protein [Pedobacter sp. UC225_65]|uniref:DUF3667 domain-containing protein n=1 Tax=Pedobacter sp. UC225_65 TaxID=3350173 RepID=UPI0036720A2A